MRAAARHHGDEANLQADVMRFMAIVAFCLIAILAMVRQTPSLPVADMPIDDQPTHAAATPQVPEKVLPELPLQTPPETEPQPVPERQPVREPVSPTAEPSLEPGPSPSRSQSPDLTLEPVPSTASAEPAADEEQGLTLRFASQSDFLRLVAKGRVTVYAFDKSQFLSLDRGYSFHQISPPAQVYELDTATIPLPMRRALPTPLQAADMTWAVGLASKVEQQIQKLIGRVEHGQLLINRYEEVHHVSVP